jgi:tetratricopeptide (TPR) repeat protein
MGKLERRARRRGKTAANAEAASSNVQRGQSDGNERQLRRLAAFLEDAAGFQLGLVTYDTREVRDEQLERLAERFRESPVWLTRLDFTETPQEKQLLDRLREHLDGLSVPDGKRPAVMVVGIEATLDYRRLGPGAGEGMAMLENANAQRDAFARHCPASVVLWLNPTAASMLALRAPDLWHWRNGTFRFTSPAAARQQIERRLAEMPLLESDSLPRRDKLERIATLRDLLAELDASPTAATPRSRRRRVALLNELGLALLATGEARAAIPVLEETLAVAREIGDRGGESNALGNLGNAYAELGDAHKAIQYHEQALMIAREIGDRRGEGAALGNLGNAYADLGDARKAIQYHEQQLMIGREIGYRRGEGNALGSLGNAYAQLGDARKAIQYHEQQLAIDREIGDRRGEGNALGNLGIAYARLGDARKAIQYYEQQLAIDCEIGYRRGEGAALGNLGVAYGALGDARKAIEHYEQHLAIVREIGDRPGQCGALGNLGDEWRRLGETEKARVCLDEGLRLALLAHDPGQTTWCAWQLADLYSDYGDAATAVALEVFAFSRFRAMGYPQAEAAGGNLARHRKEMGEAKFREALGRAEETVAAIFRDLAGEAAAEMAAGIIQAFTAEENGAG